MIAGLNAFSNDFVTSFAALTLQNSIFLVGLLGLLFVFRKQSARFLNLIALIGFIKLLLPPFLSLPTFSIEAAAVPEFLHALTAPTQISAQIVQGRTELTLRAAFFLSWLLIALFLFSLPVLNALRMRRRLRSAKLINVDIPGLPATGGVSFWLSPEVESPLVFGFWQHKVVLPMDWLSWSVKCRNAVIAHELAHIRNGDHWIGFMQLVAKSLYFFNPLVFILSRKLSYYREIACDDAAIAAIRVSRIDYSRYLVRISEAAVKQRYGFISSSAFSQPQASMKNRIRYLLKERQQAGFVLTLRNRIIIAVLLAATLPLSFNIAVEPALSVTGTQPALLRDALVPTQTGTTLLSESLDDNSGTPPAGKENCLIYDKDGNPVDTSVQSIAVRTKRPAQPLPLVPVKLTTHSPQ